MSASIILHFYVGRQALCHLSGNARVAGMSTDLHLVGLRYNTAAAVFFVRFSLLLFLKYVQPSLRFYTLVRKSRRKSEQDILIL
jgi:hypothetical protein